MRFDPDKKVNNVDVKRVNELLTCVTIRGKGEKKDREEKPEEIKNRTPLKYSFSFDTLTVQV